MSDDAPQPSELVERLASRLRSASMGDRQYERPMEWSEADQLLAYIAKLQADGDKLAVALEPFAECCGQIAEHESDEEWAKFRLLIGDYRRATQALTEWKDRA
jgi:hypothetical protein